MPKAFEINFDGIVGPTHHYGGLSLGNEASMKHGDLISSPKQAALEGLKKMKFLHGLGLKQAVLPPQERPDMAALKELGFFGTDEEILKKLSEYEGTYLNMLGAFQDPTGSLYSYADRKNYYIDVLTYWNTIIHTKCMKVELV